MIPESLTRKLAGNERPEDDSALERELAIARSNGHRVPEIDLSSTVITAAQARLTLSRLKVSEDELFWQVMLTYRRFPLGIGGELLDLDEILQRSMQSTWSADYPDFPERFLELSSGEGEGSYLYERSTGFVFDIGWNAMDDLIAGKLTPKWTDYAAFLESYYGVEPK